MKKNKGKELLKVITISTLSIGFFSMGFIGVNNIAIAAQKNPTVTMPSVSSELTTSSIENQLGENYQKPVLNVYEPTNNYFNRGANSLSPEHAAEIGSLYIWEMFGESIEGKTVEMFYSAHPAFSRTSWFGMVGDSQEAIENGEILFTFGIDGVTGERIDITRTLSSDSSLEEKTITREESYEMTKQIPEEIDMYEALAKEYAQRHFNNSEVVDVTFDNMNFLFTGRGSESNSFTYSDRTLIFDVTDDTGRVARLGIVKTTQELFSLTTQHNDHIPGFDAYVEGSLG